MGEINFVFYGVLIIIGLVI